jgi:hypothetical protein
MTEQTAKDIQNQQLYAIIALFLAAEKENNKQCQTKN